MNDFANENESNALINNNETATSKTFNYKLKLIGISRLNIVVVLLKFLSKFWRSLDLPLINCETELDLSWSKKCIMSQISRTSEMRENNRVIATKTTGVTFQVNNA